LFSFQAIQDATKFGQVDEPPLLDGEKAQESTCKHFFSFYLIMSCLNYKTTFLAHLSETFSGFLLASFHVYRSVVRSSVGLFVVHNQFVHSQGTRVAINL